MIKLVCIEYPGIVLNLNNMLETLGGLDNIIKTCENSSLRLQLRFRPKDPFSHVAFGDNYQTNSLLAKTIKKKITYSDGSVEIVYKTKIIGIIETTFKFKTLADFQYLPIERTNFDPNKILKSIITNFDEKTLIGNSNEENEESTSKDEENSLKEVLDNDKTLKNNLSCNEIINNLSNQEKPTYKSILEEVYPCNPLDGNVSCFNENAPLFLMPIIFSRFDSPSDYYYKSEPKNKSKEVSDEQDKLNETVFGANRKSRAKFVYLATFGEDPPTKPNIEFEKSIDKNLENKIREDFNSQPIWMKSELAYRNNCDKKELKLILPLIAFYYTNGPFRGQWVRFGYNPKEDKNCILYQTLDLRTKHLLDKKLRSNEFNKNLVYNAIKSCSSEKKNKDKSNQNKLHNISLSSSNLDELKKTNEANNESSFKYYPDQLPLHKQIFYQLRNIEDEEIKKLLKELPAKDICDEKDGWLPTGSIEKIRSIMTNQVEKLLIEKIESNSNELTLAASDTSYIDEEKELNDLEEEMRKIYD